MTAGAARARPARLEAGGGTPHSFGPLRKRRDPHSHPHAPSHVVRPPIPVPSLESHTARQNGRGSHEHPRYARIQLRQSEQRGEIDGPEQQPCAQRQNHQLDPMTLGSRRERSGRSRTVYSMSKLIPNLPVASAWPSSGRGEIRSQRGRGARPIRTAHLGVNTTRKGSFSSELLRGPS